MTLAYVAQAIMTALLTIRRQTVFGKNHWVGKGIPVIQREQSVGRHHYSVSTLVITDAEARSLQLVFLGLLVSFITIPLHTTNIEWQCVRPLNGWIYMPESAWIRAQRCCIGWSVSALTYSLLLGAFSDSWSYSFMWTLYCRVRDALFRIDVIKKVPEPLIWIALAILLALASFKVARAVEKRIPRPSYLSSIPGMNGRTMCMLPIIYVAKPFLDSFDFARQTPTKYHFLRRDLNERQSASEQYRLLNEARLKFAALYSVNFVMGSGLFALFTIRVASMFDKGSTGYEIPPTTSTAGCVYTRNMYTWTWKDPLADKLWAF